MKGVKLTAISVIAPFLTLFLLLITPTLSSASPTNENLWSENNSVSLALTLADPENANGPTTGTLASASGKWAAGDGIWTFTIENSAIGSGAIDNVVLRLKHYVSGWTDDDFTVEINDGASWITVRSYTNGDGPPTVDFIDNWDVYSLVINTWDKINNSVVRIIGGSKKAGEDTVTWYVDTVSLAVKYSVAVAEWNLIETWTNATVEAPAKWQVVETWTNAKVESPTPSQWNLVETWTNARVEVPTPSQWNLIETWTVNVEASADWQLIESWTGVVGIVVMSSSRVDSISPYWQTFVPFTIIVTASDLDGYVENVELWYRYATDNLSWSLWVKFGLDNDNYDGWHWSFSSPSGDDYYEFYSIAKDNDGNVEPAPAEADSRVGVDTVAPTIASIVIDDDANSTTSTSVTLTIDASDATSGLAEMRFSPDDVNWSDWEDFAASKSYTIPTGDGIKTVYVQVKDNAGLSSAVASDSILLETIPLSPPVEPSPSVTPPPVTPLPVSPPPVSPSPVSPPHVSPPSFNPPPTPMTPSVVPPPIQPPPFLYAVLFMTASVVGFAAVYRMLARPSRYYVMLKQLERAIFRPRIRRIGKLLPKPPARAPRRVSRVELAALGRLERVARKRLDLS